MGYQWTGRGLPDRGDDGRTPRRAADVALSAAVRLLRRRRRRAGRPRAVLRGARRGRRARRLLLLRAEAARPRLRARPAPRPRRPPAPPWVLLERARVRPRALPPAARLPPRRRVQRACTRRLRARGLRGRLAARPVVRALRRRPVPDDGRARARLGGDGLHHLLGDVEVRVDLLNVVVLLERVDQPERLLRRRLVL